MGKEKVPAGYKMTEVGVIPEDWEATELSALISGLEAGVSVNSSAKGNEFGSYEKYVLKTSCVNQGKFFPNERKPIIAKDIRRARLSPQQDSIIISRMNTPALVGESGYVGSDFPDLFLPDRLWITRHSIANSLCVRWLAYVLGSENLRKVLKDSATGTSGSMKNIAKAKVLSIQIVFPTIREQQAIATALSDADALIESLEQHIAKKRLIKQGAMQELLTGKRRLPGFSGEWEPKLLGQLGKFLKGSGVTRDEAQSGSIPCVRYGEIYTAHNEYIKEFGSWISESVASFATKLKDGDLLFAGSGETKGEIGKCVAYVHEGDAFAGGDIVILRPEISGSSLFLGYYLNSPAIVQQKASKGQGDAIVHISSTALASIRISLPSAPEQTAIAAVLTDMDEEITALETKLSKARQVKQGMMQELLTGRIRLV